MVTSVKTWSYYKHFIVFTSANTWLAFCAISQAHLGSHRRRTQGPLLLLNPQQLSGFDWRDPLWAPRTMNSRAFTVTDSTAAVWVWLKGSSLGSTDDELKGLYCYWLHSSCLGLIEGILFGLHGRWTQGPLLLLTPQQLSGFDWRDPLFHPIVICLLVTRASNSRLLSAHSPQCFPDTLVLSLRSPAWCASTLIWTSKSTSRSCVTASRHSICTVWLTTLCTRTHIHAV